MRKLLLPVRLRFSCLNTVFRHGKPESVSHRQTLIPCGSTTVVAALQHQARSTRSHAVAFIHAALDDRHHRDQWRSLLRTAALQGTGRNLPVQGYGQLQARAQGSRAEE